PARCWLRCRQAAPRSCSSSAAARSSSSPYARNKGAHRHRLDTDNWMPLEREIKLRFGSADEARERILALGATPLLGRRLQEDCLFDTDDERLRRQRSTLRVRSEGGKALLTFKGPAIPAAIKIREEYETVVSDGAVLQTILEELGLHVWFRY